MYDTYEPARMSYARAQTNASICGEHEKKIHAYEPFSINSIYVLDLSTCAAHACMHMSDLFNMTNKTVAKKSSQVYTKLCSAQLHIFSIVCFACDSLVFPVSMSTIYDVYTTKHVTNEHNLIFICCRICEFCIIFVYVRCRDTDVGHVYAIYGTSALC